MGRLPRNDLAQYDELADQWWETSGGFAALHWLAASRAEHIPPAPGPDAVLVDLACGGGLVAPPAARLGHRHLGADIGAAGPRGVPRAGGSAGGGSVVAPPLGLRWGPAGAGGGGAPPPPR